MVSLETASYKEKVDTYLLYLLETDLVSILKVILQVLT